MISVVSTAALTSGLASASGLAPELPDARIVSAPLVLVGFVVGAMVFTSVSAVVVRRVVRHVADRSLVRPSRLWRTRARRAGTEPGEVVEQRRKHRIDAASRMVNHLVSLVVWLVTTVAVFHVLEIDAALFLSSAGFLGAAVAIGGQHRVNDYLTGLLVHFEDRYGVGDEVEFDAGWSAPVRAVIDHVGLFSTRVRDEISTLHFPNSSMAQVRNLSQESAATTLRVRANGRPVEDVAATLRKVAGTQGLTEVVFLGDIAGHEPTTGEVQLDVHTLRPLDQRASATLVERAEQRLQET
ncbi:MAG: mechanosensitive ion channel domain-containing protein [Ilumatobacteraceae bacterium]